MTCRIKKYSFKQICFPPINGQQKGTASIIQVSKYVIATNYRQ